MNSETIAQRAQELQNALQILRRTKFSIKGCAGSSGAERFLLLQIGMMSNGQPVMPTLIAKKLGITLAAVTHLLNSLDKQGYIERIPSPDDRRVVYVGLSKKGAEALGRIKNHHDEKLRGLIEHLGVSDSAGLIRLIGKVSDYMKQNNRS